MVDSWKATAEQSILYGTDAASEFDTSGDVWCDCLAGADVRCGVGYDTEFCRLYDPMQCK